MDNKEVFNIIYDAVNTYTINNDGMNFGEVLALQDEDTSIPDIKINDLNIKIIYNHEFLDGDEDELFRKIDEELCFIVSGDGVNIVSSYHQTDMNDDGIFLMNTYEEYNLEYEGDIKKLFLLKLVS